MRPAGAVGRGDGFGFALTLLHCIYNRGGETGAVGAGRIFYAALREFHTAAAGAALRSQDFENRILLRSGKTLQVYTGQSVCRLPLLAEHKTGAQQGKNRIRGKKPLILLL